MNPFKEDTNPFEDVPLDVESGGSSAPTRPPKAYDLEEPPEKPAKEEPLRPTKTVPLTPAGNDYDQRLAALELREQNVLMREAALESREEMLEEREKRIPQLKPKNWPPYPWPKPFLHHNIAEEIPKEHQNLVRFAYVQWFVVMVLLLVNVILCICIQATCASNDEITLNAMADLILSIVYFVVWPVVTFLIYRLLYKGCRALKGIRFFFFFGFFGFEFLVHVAIAVGAKHGGCAGFFWMLFLFKNEAARMAWACMFNFAFWVAVLVFMCFIFIKTRVAFRSLGGIRETRKEAARIASYEAASHPEIMRDVVEGAANAYYRE